MKPRYIKVIRDLTANYSKNFMLVLAIAVGVFGVGSILGGRAVINREMATNYMSTKPASATIEFEGTISRTLLDSIKAFPGIRKAERRATITARMKVNDHWYPILLFVIDDFNKMEVSTFLHLSGSQNPNGESMLVERTALTVMHAKEGDDITIKTPHGESHTLRIAGLVHDPGLAPAWQQQAGYAYITLDGLRHLGETQDFNLLRLQVSENEYVSSEITKKAEQVANLLEKKGITIHEIQVPQPGKHPHQSQMNAVLTIFTIFCFMILILGSILVATSIATLMAKQVRQIGVMKTIGGTSMQISGLYLLMLFAVCIIALIVSIPLSRLAAYGFYTQIASLLNLEITDKSIPWTVPAIQILSGIAIPFLTTAVPLVRGSRISVRAALDNYGVSAKSQAVSFLSRLPFNVPGNTFRLALRNAFRQRSRLALTLGLLAAGGAMFMTALNVSDAWDQSLTRIYKQRLYDQEIRLNERINPDSAMDRIKSMNGVTAVEGWDYSSTSIANERDYEITKTYPDKGHGSFTMLALPIDSKLLNPTITEGQWLNKAGTNDVVLNQLARTDGMKIGDEVSLFLEDKPTTWKIIGFTEDVGSSAAAYVSLRRFEKLNESFDQIKMIRIAYTDRSKNYTAIKNREVDRLLEDLRLSVDSSTPVWLLRNAVAAHMRVLVNALLTMAILMALVGTLGLTSTISMNILERTREIGVMRAIGATPNKIRNLIVSEGLAIGVFSIVLAFLVSIGLSYLMGEFIGNISFRTPLGLTISLTGIFIWISIVTIGSYLATILPARRANIITTREALSYE
ncbi:MAG TPA: FtsX-like permease family protein [Cyclobacteriaceae bacterium]|nr:FtsX-like permease family protein [Cyclobacteriaceae bacterium]